MLSEMAAEDCAELERAGAKLSPAEVVRLNALGVRSQRSPDAVSFDALPRCAWLGDDLMFREPTIGHEMWMTNADRIFDRGDELTGFMIRALALATPLDDLPDWSSLKEMRDALEEFAVEKLAKYTVRQVTCCVMWCMFGSDWAADERAASRDDDECDDGHDDELTSPSVGVIRDGMALGLGISLHDAMHMTRSGLHAVVMRAYKLKGVDVSKSVYDRAIGDYYATLDEIKRNHAKEMEKHGE